QILERTSHASIKLKTAVLAPIPRASMIRVTAVKTGLLRKRRRACRRSFIGYRPPLILRPIACKVSGHAVLLSHMAQEEQPILCRGSDAAAAKPRQPFPSRSLEEAGPAVRPGSGVRFRNEHRRCGTIGVPGLIVGLQQKALQTYILNNVVRAFDESSYWECRAPRI